ncbi:MAG: dihydropyrimidinase [Phycisphaerales bacterium]|nr:MAG: dihydropyrimidinase [Phycisphaerales bacterium]
MKLDTIIQHGQLVSSNDIIEADLGISGEKIVAIGQDLAATQANGVKIVDARGRYLIPGGVDVHVHLDLPFCGTVSSDDFDSGTRAAACGGVTTVIDFAIPYGEQTLQQAVDNWHAKARDKACVDYSFHLAITNWSRQAPEIKKMVEQGIPTFKQFMIYESEGWQSDDAAMFSALETLKELGGMLMVHAESSRVLDLLIARHHTPEEMSKHGAYLHTITRPCFVEAEAIERAIRWTRETQGRLYVVHMSTGEGADLVRQAQGDGVHVLAETCPQYLVLDDSLFAGKDGHLYATCPQIKKRHDQERLWAGLKSGEVCVVSTDTCTFTREQKAMWEGDFTKIPMGMPGIETLLPVVYTHGVLEGRLTVNQFVAKCCTNPAKVMGLFPRKGALAVGSDADLAVIHPTDKREVDCRKMQTNCDWSPYQGWSLAGFAEHAFCRGRQVVENHNFVGKNGHGQFIARANVGFL